MSESLELPVLPSLREMHIQLGALIADPFGPRGTRRFPGNTETHPSVPEPGDTVRRALSRN